MGAEAGAVAAAAAAEIARAIKASGAIIELVPEEFLKIASMNEKLLIVWCYEKGIFSEAYKYMTSYKGLFFYTKSKFSIEFPKDTEFINSKKIWIPG